MVDIVDLEDVFRPDADRRRHHLSIEGERVVPIGVGLCIERQRDHVPRPSHFRRMGHSDAARMASKCQ